MDLPETLRITNAGWSEGECAWKVQLGDNEQTVAYAWVPSGVGGDGYSRAMEIARRICEGWNA